MAPNSIPPNEIQRLRSLQQNLNRLKNGVNGGSTRGGIEKTISGASKTPWGKIALGAAAIGGAGALGWKYWQNKKAMQRDMQNGIPQ